MKKIKSLDELHAEKLRLKLELIAAEEVLKEDLKTLKEDLQPENILSGLFNRVVGNNLGGLFGKGAGFLIDAILKKVILSRAGWVTKLVVPLVAKTFFANYAADNKGDIYGYLKGLIRKARKHTAKTTNSQYYDKSTVDEMDL